MKRNYKYILPIAALGMVGGSVCFAGGPGAGTMPPITEPPSSQPSTEPSTVVAQQTAVPDKYVWDGYENVGFVNNQAYYLGPGNVWMPLDATRQAHFNDWLRMNPDWQSHAVKNVQYDKIEAQTNGMYNQGQIINRQDQYRNSPINRTDQNGPPVRPETDHNGPPQ